jgi:hypothetical protein
VRKNDARLIGYNKITASPSGALPDQIALTLGDDPSTSIVVHWRTSTAELSGRVRYQEKSRYTGFGEGDEFLTSFHEAPLVIDSPRESILAEYASIDDYPGGLIDLRPEPGNDPVVNRHIVQLSELRPATTYMYTVGSGAEDGWSAPREFTTAHRAGDEASKRFSFVYMGDVQEGFSTWEHLANRALQSAPHAGFSIMAGDLVNEGQQRHEWDAFFKAGENLFSEIPIVPVLGNHEYNGLEPVLFKNHFRLPNNGPEGLEEKVYSFEYGNAFFAVVDGNLKGEAELSKQTAWLDQQLTDTRATWKFVAIHQPIYGSRPTQDEPVLREAFLPIIDKHQVDFFLQGHTHGYLRTQSMKEGAVVEDGKGTVYLVANAGTKHSDVGGFVEKYGVEPAVMLDNASTYQVIDINDTELRYRAYDVNGAIVDSYSLIKEVAVPPAPTPTPTPIPAPTPAPRSSGGIGSMGLGCVLALMSLMMMRRRTGI